MTERQSDSRRSVISLSAGSGDDGGGPRCEYDVAGEKCGSRTVPEVPEAPERRRSLHAVVPGARLVVGGGTERAWPLRGNWWGRDGAERVLCSVMWGRNCCGARRRYSGMYHQSQWQEII